MSDDFGTLNLKRADRSRELGVLRQHRESIMKMLSEVDQQIRELELSSAPVASSATPAPQGAPPAHPARRGIEDAPLMQSPEYEDDTQAVANPGGGPRVVLILGAAVLVLAVIGYLIWRASSDRPKTAATGTVVEETATASPVTAEETDTVAPAAANSLAIAPASADYGLIRKGTRATRQFEVANNTDQPMSIAVSRSACRCLYYEHAPVVPPKAKESVTVTVDGAKAKAGNLRETIKISSKSDPLTTTSFDVIATVR